MHIAQQRSRSDAEFYQMHKLADANKVLLTSQYLELRKYEAIAQNNKIFYGSDIPNMFLQGGCDKVNTVAANTEQKVEWIVCWSSLWVVFKLLLCALHNMWCLAQCTRIVDETNNKLL